MNKKTSIYFIENSFDYNAYDLNSNKVGGSEKTLINISNEAFCVFLFFKLSIKLDSFFKINFICVTVLFE